MVVSRTHRIPERSAAPALPARPIVRSSRLVHRGTTTLGPSRQVLGQPAPAPEVQPKAVKPARKFRFARPLVAAAVLSAGLARADGPRLGGAEPASEILRGPTLEPAPEVLELAPRLPVVEAPVSAPTEALGAKMDGLKESPYEAKPGLVKRTPRARRMAWKRSVEPDYQKVSDLKANPYE